MAERLVNAAEIGRLLEPPLTRERVRQLAGRDDFPAPRVDEAHVRLWDLGDVRRWARQRGRSLRAVTAADEAAIRLAHTRLRRR